MVDEAMQQNTAETELDRRNSAKSWAASAMVSTTMPMKERLVARVPVLKDAAGVREVRRVLTEELGGAIALREELARAGFVDENGLLSTGPEPFNVFVQIVCGGMEQPDMASEQAYLGRFQCDYTICRNRSDCETHWDSQAPEWVGRASMAKRHRFMTTKDLRFEWFNALTFGLVEEVDGGVGKARALAKLEDMKRAALLYASGAPGWSSEVGMFFHVFGHNSVNSLHLHIVDMAELGPGFHKMEYKNCPLDAVIQVLREELEHERAQTPCSPQRWMYRASSVPFVWVGL